MNKLFHLQTVVNEYVNVIQSNGISQHDIKWHEAKQDTIGGSQLATVQRANPYSTISSVIREKSGIDRRTDPGIKAHWGSLLESMLKRYVELANNIEIAGSNIFIAGKEGSHTSYSPDGLGVVDMSKFNFIMNTEASMTTTHGIEVALFEFKCLYNRVPNKRIPKYYIPQVKMGLDMIDIATTGIFIEAVFRRCPWNNLGNNNAFDRELVTTPVPSKTPSPLAMGFVGFYFDTSEHIRCSYEDSLLEDINSPGYLSQAHIEETIFALNDMYEDEYLVNDEIINDLAVSSEDLFTLLMKCYRMGIIKVWYSDVVLGPSDYDNKRKLNDELATYTLFMQKDANVNYGVMGWKLFSCDYHRVDKEPGYISLWQEHIDDVIGLTKKCRSTDPASREKVLNDILISRRDTQYHIIR